MASGARRQIIAALARFLVAFLPGYFLWRYHLQCRYPSPSVLSCSFSQVRVNCVEFSLVLAIDCCLGVEGLKERGQRLRWINNESKA